MEKTTFVLGLCLLFVLSSCTPLSNTHDSGEKIQLSSSNFDASTVAEIAAEILRNDGNFERIKTFLTSHAPQNWTADFDRALISALYHNPQDLDNVHTILTFLRGLDNKPSGVRMLEELFWRMNENGQLNNPQLVSLAKVLRYYSTLPEFQQNPEPGSSSIVSVEQMVLEWLVASIPKGLEKLFWDGQFLLENRNLPGFNLKMIGDQIFLSRTSSGLKQRKNEIWKVDMDTLDVDRSTGTGQVTVNPYISLQNGETGRLLQFSTHNNNEILNDLSTSHQGQWEVTPVEGGKFFVFRNHHTGCILEQDNESNNYDSDLCRGLRSGSKPCPRSRSKCTNQKYNGSHSQHWRIF